MILGRSRHCVLAGLALACAGTAAHADVMELDADGARWVAGGSHSGSNGIVIGVQEQQGRNTLSAPSITAATVTGAGITDTIIAGATIPDTIVVNPSSQAGRVPTRYAAKVRELSQRFDLSETLIEALVWQESRWRETAVSHSGARGLAQLMPGTAAYLGVDADDPLQNLEGGARYLREQLDRFDGDLEKALAAYNAGPGRVVRAGGIPNIRETRHYVAAIMGRLSDHSRPGAR